MEPGDETEAPWFLLLRERRVDDAWQLLAQEDVDVNLRDAHGDSALHYAAAVGDRLLIERLLGAGADTTARAPATHETPLHRSRFHGHDEIVRRLFECDEITRALERRLGRESTLVERTSTLVSLLEAPFRDAVRKASKRASHTSIHAARSGDLAKVREMLESGEVHKDAVHRVTGETAITAALAHGRMTVCDYLLTTHNVSVHGPCLRDGHKYSAVMVAVVYKDASLVRRLVAHGARLDTAVLAGNKRKISALSLAVELGCIDIVDVLLDAGASIPLNMAPQALWRRWDARFVGDDDRSVWMVLALACWNRQRALVRHVLATRPALQQPDETRADAISVLCFAVYQCDHAILRELFGYGFDRLLACRQWCEHRDLWPFMYPLYSDSVVTLQLLVDHTPRETLVYAAETRAGSLLQSAVYRRAAECVAHLLHATNQGMLTLPGHLDGALQLAVDAQNLALAEPLLDAAMATLSVQTFRELLASACDAWWCPELVGLVLARCCLLPFVNQSELDRVLLYACKKFTSVATLHILLAYGADANAQGDALLRTARHDDGAPLVLCLLDHGVDVITKERGGDTSLSLLLDHQQKKYDATRDIAIKRLLALGALPPPHVA